MRRWKKPALIALAAALVLAALVYFARPVPAEVDLAAATRGPLRETIDEDGKTRIKDRFVVSAPLAGRLQRITLRAGDRVFAGDTLLAVIEPRDPELLDASARAQAEARVKAADANRKQSAAQAGRALSEHTLAAAELARVKSAAEHASVSLQEMDAAESRERAASELLRAAQFAVQVADFEAEQARAALLRTRPRSTGEPDDSRFEIRSPIDGRLLRVMQESATVVAPGTALVELGNIADLEVVVDVLSTDAVRVSPGARVILEHWGGREPLTARVRLVEPGAFTKVSALGVEEQRVNIVADFAGPPELYARLGDGYRVEARIVVWESESVLKIPSGAIFRRGDGWAVFRHQRGRAVLQPLQIGHSDGRETEIIDGLSEGDEIVLHPSDKVSDRVRISPR